VAAVLAHDLMFDGDAALIGFGLGRGALGISEAAIIIEIVFADDFQPHNVMAGGDFCPDGVGALRFSSIQFPVPIPVEEFLVFLQPFRFAAAEEILIPAEVRSEGLATAMVRLPGLDQFISGQLAVLVQIKGLQRLGQG